MSSQFAVHFPGFTGHLPDILPVPRYILFPAIMAKQHGTFHLCSDFLRGPDFILFPCLAAFDIQGVEG